PPSRASNRRGRADRRLGVISKRMISMSTAYASRIAHLIESDGPGGAERIVAQLATALQAAGTENVVFLPADGEGWLARELEGSGVAIEYFRIERPVSAAGARALVQAFCKWRIGVAHSH